MRDDGENSKNTKSRTFEVGYGRPPRHTRFARGQSGNPCGRRRGVRNLASDVKRTLEVPVKVTHEGKRKKVSTQEAVLLQLRQKALNGDARSLDRLLSLANTFNNIASGSSTPDELAAEDEAILAAYENEILTRSSRRLRHKSTPKQPECNDE
jgi:hypothetical protein